MTRTATTEDLVRARLELARLEPGGTADRPQPLPSASLVQVEATAAPCLRCESRVVLEDHIVEHTGAGLVRVAEIRCPMCGLRRNLYFRIVEPH